jgi:uncharacterized protein (DUF1697 family)
MYVYDMALVVLLRGVNVGGHRSFRPTTLARQLEHLDVVNIGAAGTFVIRQPIDRTRLRAELRRRLPFEAEIAICEGREFTRMMATDCFSEVPRRPDVVRFVSLLSRRARNAPSMPLAFPSRGKWLLRVLRLEDRFVLGAYRRHMKVIGYLGMLDRLFGVPATTRNWNTVEAIARVLSDSRTCLPTSSQRSSRATVR